MERLAIVSHNSFRAIGFHKSRSPSPPYGPAPQGSQLITLSCLVALPGANMQKHNFCLHKQGLSQNILPKIMRKLAQM